MSVTILDTLAPNGPFPAVDDDHLGGGFRVVANNVERDAITEERQVVGMFVLVSGTRELWRLTVTGSPPTYERVFLLGSGGNIISLSQVLLSTLSFGADDLVNIDARALYSLTTNSANNRHSRVFHGCELHQYLDSVIISPAVAPALKLENGVCMTAAGTRVRVEGRGSQEIAIQDGSPIEGGSIGSIPRPIYAFLRNNDGDPSNTALRFSLLAPDARGRPNSADGGYTVNDYCYVGCVYGPLTLSGTDQQDIWGHAWSAHPTTGQRIFTAPDETLANSNTASDVSTSYSIIQGPMTTNPLATFETAREMVISGEIYVTNSIAAGYTVTVQAEGFALPVRVGASSNVSAYFAHRFPIRNERIDFTAKKGDTTTGLDCQITSVVTGIVENVNEPIPQIINKDFP